MPPLALLALQVGTGLVACALVAAWHVAPRLAVLPRERAIVPLLWAHVPRTIALSLLAPGQVGAAVSPHVSATVGWGDFASGVLALSALVALRLAGPRAWPWVWACVLAGAVDVVAALSVALSSVVYRLPLGAGWYVLVGYVPAVCVAQALCFRVLLRERATEEKR